MFSITLRSRLAKTTRLASWSLDKVHICLSQAHFWPTNVYFALTSTLELCTLCTRAVAIICSTAHQHYPSPCSYSFQTDFATNDLIYLQILIVYMQYGSTARRVPVFEACYKYCIVQAVTWKLLHILRSLVIFMVCFS